jgi:hypothetical protein
MQEYYLKHKERIDRRNLEWIQKHRARARQINRASKTKNREPIRKRENEYRKRWAAARKARVGMIKRLLKYNLKPGQFDSMFAEQQGMCKICGSPLAKTGTTGAQVDHDHVTGKIRGLLCMNCNHGIGCFGDDPELMLKAVAYVQSFSAQRNEKTEIHPMLTEVA